jgi:hypothetical protein
VIVAIEENRKRIRDGMEIMKNIADDHQKQCKITSGDGTENERKQKIKELRVQIGEGCGAVGNLAKEDSETTACRIGKQPRR